MTEAEELEMLELEEEAAKAGAPSPAPAPAPPPKEEPSKAAAALAGVQQLGSFGWGDELGAALQGGLMKATGRGGYLDTYRQARVENREETKAAKAAHPGAYYGAGLPFGVASSLAVPAVKAGQGAALLTRALAGGATGLLQGGLAGAGDSEADTAGGVAKDTATGALINGAVGGALPVGGSVLRRALAKPTEAAANSLEQTAINQGRRVLTNGADSLSRRNKVRDDAVVEAIRGGGIKPFGTTAGALERLKDLGAKEHAAYNEIVGQLAEKGVRGPDAEALAQKLLGEATDLEANTMNPALPGLYRETAAQVQSKAGSPAAQRLGLIQSENLKRSLQEQAKYGRFDETPANEVRRDIASMFRQANEEAIDEQAKRSGDPALRALAGQFVPVKQKLGRLIEATSAAERGAARGAQRNAFGLKDVAAGGAAIASGHPGFAPVAAIASNVLNNRVPSAVASYGLSAADSLRRGGSSELSPTLQALILALRGQRERNQEQAP